MSDDLHVVKKRKQTSIFFKLSVVDNFKLTGSKSKTAKIFGISRKSMRWYVTNEKKLRESKYFKIFISFIYSLILK